MRRFLFSFSAPDKCDCCGAELRAMDTFMERASYQLSLPECKRSVETRIGLGVRIVLGGGRLIVELQSTAPGLRWELQPLFNTDAFSHPKVYRNGPTTSYIFEMLPFKPWYSTWWAELKFIEVQPFVRNASGGFAQAHNGASFSARLETLE